MEKVKLCSKNCGHDVEAPQYSMCKECWWNQDPRNTKNGGTVDLEKYKEKKEMNLVSLNNKFVVEPYKGDRTLKANSASGFAIVQQKVSIIGLRLLVDSLVQVGPQARETLPKGSMIYVREELLFTQEWAKKVYESDAIEGKFILVDASQVEFVRVDEEQPDPADIPF